MIVALVALAAVLVLINAVFVAAEFALVTAKRPRLEIAAAEGDRRAKRALAATRELPRQLAGSQLGITVCSLGLGLLGEPALARVIEPIVELVGDPSHSVVHGVALVASLLIVVTAHMVLGEMVPKTLALAAPEKALLALAPFTMWFSSLFRPFIWFLDATAAAIVRAFGVVPKREMGRSPTLAELAPLLDASLDEGLLEEFEHSLLSGALDFRTRPTSEVMVPRDRVVFVNRRMSVASIEEVAHRTGHSRLPVVGSGIDNVLGFVHGKDLLALDDLARSRPLPDDLIRHMQVVPHDRPLEHLMRAMRRGRSHVAVVRGPRGRTVGIVTMEDVLEELVGDINDESDIDA